MMDKPDTPLVEEIARAISKAEIGDEGEWQVYLIEAKAALAVIQPRLDALEAENGRLRRAIKEAPLPGDYDTPYNFAMAHLNWMQRAEAALKGNDRG
jgi:hypothetical protein